MTAVDGWIPAYLQKAGRIKKTNFIQIFFIKHILIDFLLTFDRTTEKVVESTKSKKSDIYNENISYEKFHVLYENI